MLKQTISFLYLTIISLSLLAQENLTLEEAVLGQFRQFAPKRIEQLQWIPTTENYCYVKDNNLYSSNPLKKNSDQILLNLETLNTWKGGEALKSMPLVQWITSASFYFQQKSEIYEASLSEKVCKLVCTLPPDAEISKYHSVSKNAAYTVGNNLYLINNGQIKKITDLPKDVVAGQSISRNEYGISEGIFWNEGGTRLAFYQKDERNVTSYPLTDYQKMPAEVREIKYPFAGMHSEHVSVGVYNPTSQKLIYLQPTDGGDNDQFYLTNLTWGPDDNTIYLAWLNRATTDVNVLVFDANSGKQLGKVLSEHDDRWLEPEHPVIFIPGKKNELLWMSQRDGFKNLYHYNTSGQLLGNTKMNFPITEILSFDAKGQNIFVMATGEKATENHCYKISLKDYSYQKMTPVAGTHQVKVSNSGNYLIDVYSNLITPLNTEIYSQGKLVRQLLVAPNPYQNKKVGRTELFTIKSNDGSDLWCRLIKPSDFDPAKKYPVLIYVYGGPHAQMVTNSYLGGSSLWMNYLAEQGYLVFTLDNHGSAHRSKDFEQIIHRQLGNAEAEDQFTGLQWLVAQSYVDRARIGIHGWSFGGFMTTNMMLRFPDQFKVGVAGGPVIDWALYEVMYGERYMDTPAENPEGYANSDLSKKVKNLKGKLLMIHGTDDDVVVMQHNMKFIKACVDHKIPVDFFAYPGHPHNVRGKDRVHLIEKIIDYVKQNL